MQIAEALVARARGLRAPGRSTPEGLEASAAGGQGGHPPGQVDGVVAEALVEAGHHGQLHGHGQWHGPGHHLHGEAHVEVVHLVVEVVDHGGGRGSRSA